MRNPEFAGFFFIHEHFERFISTSHSRHQPFWFFAPILLVTMLPWSFFIPGALGRAWRDRNYEENHAGYYLLIWATFIFLFFSKSESKLIPYILPLFPPLAILMAYRINTLLDGRGRELKAAAILLGITLAILGVACLAYTHLPLIAGFLAGHLPWLADPLREFVSSAPAVSTSGCLIIGGLFLLQGVGTLIFAGRNPMQMLVVLCLTSFMLEILAPQLIIKNIAATESPEKLALTARSLSGPDTRIVTFGLMQAVSWYTGRRVLVADRLDELEFGSRQGDQSTWFPDHDALLKLWQGSAHTLIFLKKHEFDNLLPGLKPTPRIVQQSGQRLLISNR